MSLDYQRRTREQDRGFLQDSVEVNTRDRIRNEIIKDVVGEERRVNRKGIHFDGFVILKE